MRSRLLHLRLWLEEKGLLPKGKLAFITWYFLGLDILLFLLQRLANLLHKPFGKYLGVWIVFLSFVVIVLFCVIVTRRLSSKLLWRLRNRLIVTYIFIGVIPLVLLVALAVRTIELFAGQFATFVVTSKLQAEIRDVDARNQVIARSIAAEINAGRKPETIPPIAAPGNELHISVWLNRQLLINNSKQDPPTEIPGHVSQEFAGVVSDGGKFFLRAVTNASSRQGMVAVVSSRPFDSRTLLALASDLGEVTFFEALVPKFSVGSVPEPRRMLDGIVGLPADLLVTNWPDGHPINGAAISVQTRYSKLYGYLFPVALGELASTIAPHSLCHRRFWANLSRHHPCQPRRFQPPHSNHLQRSTRCAGRFFQPDDRVSGKTASGAEREAAAGKRNQHCAGSPGAIVSAPYRATAELGGLRLLPAGA
jgi:hypothetical protein